MNKQIHQFCQNKSKKAFSERIETLNRIVVKMKIAIFCAFLIFSSNVDSKVFEYRGSLEKLSSAVVEVFAKFWSKRQFSVNFLIPEAKESFVFGDFMGKVLKKSFLTQKIFTMDNESVKTGGQKRCSLFLVESFEDFLNIYASLSPKFYLFRGFYLIVSINREIPELQTIFELMWKLQIFNVNFMFEDENEKVLVKSFMPFDSQNCNNTMPVLINTFDGEEFTKSVSEFYPEKMKKLHNCPLRFATSNNAEPYIFAKLLPNGSYSLRGRDYNLMKTLSESLNFKIDLVFVGDEGFLLENGTAKGPFSMLLKGKADVIIADYWLKVNRLKFVDYTKSYISQQIAFVIPPGKALNSFEKFIKPLDFYTWIFLLTFISLGVIVIKLVHKSSKKVQNLVFGEGIKNPNLNLVIAIFGGNIRPEPRNNFARFILMLFLIFCLIMRSLYQGSLFRFIQSKVNHKEAQSIDDMLEKNFNFFTVSAIVDLLEGQSKIYQRLTIVLIKV